MSENRKFSTAPLNRPALPESSPGKFKLTHYRAPPPWVQLIFGGRGLFGRHRYRYPVRLRHVFARVPANRSHGYEAPRACSSRGRNSTRAVLVAIGKARWCAERPERVTMASLSARDWAA